MDRKTARVIVLLVVPLVANVSRAAPPAPLSAPAPPASASAAAEDDSTKEARTQFLKGTDLVKKAEWAEALAAFETAEKLKPHAVTMYDIGACLRAMGKYTRARAAFMTALEQNDAAGGGQLSSSLVIDGAGYIKEIDGLLSRADIKLDPENGAIAVDGAPLQAEGQEAGKPLVAAGLRPPGPAETAPAGEFVLVLDPGPHVIVVSRPGYADAVINRTFAPGAHAPLRLILDTLPATIHVESNRAGAVVTVDGSDVGSAPVDVSRHEGSYHLMVKKSGYVSYDAQIVVRPGEQLDIAAKLEEYNPPIYSKWWFWAGAGVVLCGAAAGTYLLARPAPERPAPDGGSLGWAVRLN